MLIRILIAAIFSLSLLPDARALTVSEKDFLVKGFKDIEAEGTTPYRMYVPKDATGKLSLVVFLHGVGEDGNDNIKQLKNRANGAMVFAESAANPTIMIAPQNWKHAGGWADKTLRRHILGIVRATQKEFTVDDKRIYIVGLSNGGGGSWDELNAYPDLWAAAVICCGWGSATEKIKNIPVWNFHCADDPVVKVNSSDAVIAGLRKLGGNPIYTRYATGGHGSWGPAYRTKEAVDWLFAQRLGAPSTTSIPGLHIDTKTKSGETSLDKLDFTGMASMGVGAKPDAITSIDWTNTHGGASDKGSATGKEKWSIKDLPLAPGVNLIRVTATGTSYSEKNGGSTTFTDTVSVRCTATSLASAKDTKAPMAK